MSADQKRPKRRRTRGSGSLFKPGRQKIWWIQYRDAAGKRVKESTLSERKGDADLMLQKRNGSREHHLPIVKKAEQLSFEDGVVMFLDDYAVNKRDARKVSGKIDNHLRPFFGSMRMVSIDTGTIKRYIAHRIKEGIVREGKSESATSATLRSTESWRSSNAASRSRCSRDGSR